MIPLRVPAALIVAAVLVAGGSGVASGTSGTRYPLPAPAVHPEPCPPPYHPPGPPARPLPPPAVREAAIPIALAPVPRRVDLAVVSGKGIWLTVWPGSPLAVTSVVDEARAAGLHELWVRTGSTHDGFYGGPTLLALSRTAHARGMTVVAWDFPTLSDPAADIERAVQAFADGADAFSPDIESAAEGTYLTSRRVAYYLSQVRAVAGDRPVVATVPQPDAHWLAFYPYSSEAPYVDAFAPMVYWSCSEPGASVARAITVLERMRPVAPIGQDYNMGPEGGRVGLPSGAEIWRFLDVARRDGAIGASLYDLESGGAPQLATLAAYPWANVLVPRRHATR